MCNFIPATLLYIVPICSYAISGADFISLAEILTFPGILLFYSFLTAHADFRSFIVNGIFIGIGIRTDMGSESL